MKLSCPQCGATIPSVQESGFVICQYCDTTLYIDLSQASQHYYFPLQVNKNHVPGILSRWLITRELTKEYQPIETGHFYFPFWRLVQGAQSFFFPAASFPIQELEALKIPGGDFRLYESSLEEENTVIMPDIFLDSILDSKQEELKRDEGELEAFLVHLPLYTIKYQYENREYEAVIDGLHGQVFADESPPLPQLQIDRFFAMAMIGILMIFSAEFYFIPGFIKPLSIALMTAVPLHFILKFFLLQRHW